MFSALMVYIENVHVWKCLDCFKLKRKTDYEEIYGWDLLSVCSCCGIMYLVFVVNVNYKLVTNITYMYHNECEVSL